MTPTRRLPLVACLLLLAASSAQAGSFAGTSAGVSSAGSSASGSTGDDKRVLPAREDAAAFVASDGRMRSARLEAALRTLREHDASARQASDLELARRILAIPSSGG